MFVCPSILDTVSMGTPFANVVVVAKVCLARCKQSQKASGNRYAQDKRNPLKTSSFSSFYHIGKKQCGVEYGEVSVTKALAMLFPKSDW